MSHEYSMQSELDADEWDAEFRRKQGGVMTTQTKQAWTPGPWRLLHDPEDGALLEIAGPCREHKNCRKTVVFHPAHSRLRNPDDEKSVHDPHCHCEANARLISKAPDMAELLREWRRWMDTDGGALSLEIEARLDSLLADLEAV